MLFALHLLADDPPPAPESGGGGGLWFQMVLFGGIFLLFWLIVLRPIKKQEAERQQFTSLLEKNDKVLTSAGIYAQVVSVHPTEDEVTLKIDDNVKMKVTKATVVRNITKEEKLKAAQAAGTPSTGVTATPPAAPPSTAITEKK
jgi:preprotein translocase subunit YajC